MRHAPTGWKSDAIPGIGGSGRWFHPDLDIMKLYVQISNVYGTDLRCGRYTAPLDWWLENIPATWPVSIYSVLPQIRELVTWLKEIGRND